LTVASPQEAYFSIIDGVKKGGQNIKKLVRTLISIFHPVCYEDPVFSRSLKAVWLSPPRIVELKAHGDDG